MVCGLKKGLLQHFKVEMLELLGKKILSGSNNFSTVSSLGEAVSKVT